jgi:hypothetical protein
MNLVRLRQAIGEIKTDIERAITSASFNGGSCGDGQKAKEALIRSSRLIMKIHEVTKQSLDQVLRARYTPYSINPPLGQFSPELDVTGFIKKKKQDIVVLVGNTRKQREVVAEGPLEGTEDIIGKDVSETAIVIGVRSQLSSVAKNFDTLMERAFAETLNLRLRLPRLVMGEVYLLPVVEYDDDAMKNNRVAFKRQPIGLNKFIRTFYGISGRLANETNGFYKYERTALIIADFRQTPPQLCMTPDGLSRAGVTDDMVSKFERLSPEGFASDIIRVHAERHGGN